MIRINRKAFTVKIKEDRATLLACIGIAFVFWLLIKLSQTYRTEKQVLFQFEIPSDKALASVAPEDMTVQLQGTGWDRMTGRHLYHIVYALNRVGLKAEARMIAAEAVARG